MAKIALVTGGNRGLGLGTCEELKKLGYDVILTSRDESKGREKAKSIGVHFHSLDVSNPASVQALKQYVEKEFGHVDVLVNNAGVLPEQSVDLFSASYEGLKSAMDINAFGSFLMCQAFIPLMKKNKWGRVVNVSSGMGQLSLMTGDCPAYRISKAALNAVTKLFSDGTKGSGVLVNSVCPGWVKTDMGGSQAIRNLGQGVASIVWAATLPDGGPSGGFFRDGKELEW